MEETVNISMTTYQELKELRQFKASIKKQLVHKSSRSSFRDDFEYLTVEEAVLETTEINKGLREKLSTLSSFYNGLPTTSKNLKSMTWGEFRSWRKRL